jgi:glycosyltransferase involved in cell wall biosynthesis
VVFVSSGISQIVWNKCMTRGKSKRVLILEISTDGHHPFYTRLLLESELAHSADFILASRKQMLVHPAIATCATPFQFHQIGRGSVPQFFPRLANPVAILRRSWTLGSLYRTTFAEISQNAPIDFVIIPYLDNCLLGLAAPQEAFWGTPWLALTMRTMFHFPSVGVSAPKQSFTIFRRWLVDRILRQKSLAALLTIDSTLSEFSMQQRHPRFRKIQYVPDPVLQYYSALPTKAEARQRLGIPSNARVVLLYGAIDSRKGAASLVKAAASPDCSNQIHVVLAGTNWMPAEFRTSQPFQSLLTQHRIHCFDGYIDNEHEQLLLASADCMWVGYIDFYGVSGVMALAGRHAVPVIASEDGLVGYFTRKHKLGATIEPRNQASIVTALNRLVTEPEFYVSAGRNGIAAFNHHTPAELQQTVTNVAERSWA